MDNNFTLEAVPLFNSTREPWYQWLPRRKKADTLGYLKHPIMGGIEISLVPEWSQIKEAFLPYEDGKTPYDIMMVISQPDLIHKNGFLVRLGTVFISKSDEEDGNEQRLLESIMSKDDIMESLGRILNNCSLGN